MAVPKRKTSPSRRGMRRSADALKRPSYIEDKDSGELRRPHHIDLKTGMYKGRQVLKVKTEAKISRSRKAGNVHPRLPSAADLVRDLQHRRLPDAGPELDRCAHHRAYDLGRRLVDVGGRYAGHASDPAVDRRNSEIDAHRHPHRGRSW